MISLKEQIVKAKAHYPHFCIMIVCDDADQEAYLTHLLVSEEVGLKVDSDFFFAREKKEAVLIYEKLFERDRQPVMVFLSHPSQALDLVSIYRGICITDPGSYTVFLNWQGEADAPDYLDRLLMQYVIHGDPNLEYISACIGDRLETSSDDIAAFRETQEPEEVLESAVEMKSAVVTASTTEEAVEWSNESEQSVQTSEATTQFKSTEIVEKRAQEKQEWEGAEKVVTTAAKEKQTWEVNQTTTGAINDGDNVKKAPSVKKCRGPTSLYVIR